VLKGRPPARPGSAGAALAHVPRCDSDAGGRQVRGAAHAGADDDARGVALQRGAGRPPGVLRDAPQPGLRRLARQLWAPVRGMQTLQRVLRSPRH